MDDDRAHYERLYHNRSREIYLRNCYQALGVFAKLVEDLTRLSELYHTEFFSIPLNLAKKMYDLAIAIRRKLEEEDPDYNEIQRMTDQLNVMQLNQFRPMSYYLEKYLHASNGFKKFALCTVFYAWIDLEKRPSLNPFNEITLSRPNRDHARFMENFMIDFVDIIWVGPQSYMNSNRPPSPRTPEGEPVQENEETETPPVHTLVLSHEPHHFDTQESVGSFDESDEEEDSDVEDNYITIDKAEFDYFDDWLRSYIEQSSPNRVANSEEETDSEESNDTDDEPSNGPRATNGRRFAWIADIFNET